MRSRLEADANESFALVRSHSDPAPTLRMDLDHGVFLLGHEPARRHIYQVDSSPPP